MNPKTLIHSSVVAAVLVAAVIGVGMATGYAVTLPLIPTDPVNSANPGGEPAPAGTPMTGFAPFIQIDPIGEKTTGDLLIIRGSTNLPNGTILMIQTGSAGVGSGSDTIVRESMGGINRFSAPVDTTILKPGTITITITRMEGDLEKGDYRMGTPNATTTFMLNGMYRGTDTPVRPATVTKDDYLTIDAIGNRVVGDQFLMTGTTSLPAGTGLIWQIMPYTGTIPTSLDMNATGIMANSPVTKGDDTANRVSLAVDMADQPPGEYLVIVGEMEGDITTGDIRIGDLTGSALFSLK